MSLYAAKYFLGATNRAAQPSLCAIFHCIHLRCLLRLPPAALHMCRLMPSLGWWGVTFYCGLRVETFQVYEKLIHLSCGSLLFLLCILHFSPHSYSHCFFSGAWCAHAVVRSGSALSRNYFASCCKFPVSQAILVRLCPCVTLMREFGVGVLVIDLSFRTRSLLAMQWSGRCSKIFIYLINEIRSETAQVFSFRKML